MSTATVVDQQLIKSRQRVRAHGEVFTPHRMVSQMLDLVSLELETGPNFVDKTFFEPAAGDGNFLVEILRRKLHAITKRYQPSVQPMESLFAIASIYGVELLEDNHVAAKANLMKTFTEFHAKAGVPCGPRTNLFRSATALIDWNIVRGNTITELDWLGNEITFSWWNRIRNGPAMVQREPFTLASLRDRNTGRFDLTVQASYSVCLIQHVYKE
jgi:hypothetical protein